LDLLFAWSRPVIRPLALASFVACSLAACGDPEDPSGADSSSSGASETTAAPTTGEPPLTSSSETTADPPVTTSGEFTTGDGLTTGDATTTDTPITTGEPDTTTTGDDTTTTGDDTTTTSDDTTDGTTGDGLAPELPEATMECPELVDGTVQFHPEGITGPRAVRIWMDPDLVDELDGPVVFYWHGTGGQPNEAQSGLGEMGIQEILDAGGIVVAPTSDPMAGIFPWYLVTGDKQDDLLVADEVLACAQAQFGVDATRIHSLGFSAGALHTAQMSIRRSSWIASVVLYSGGLIFGSMPAFEQPDNPFAAMLFHGGPGDVVVLGFKQASEDYQKYLTANDNFSFICDHGQGHTIPPEQDSVMQFFAEHSFGTAPEPYANALPGDFPAYCALP
jgi:predicted esterase